MLNEVLWSLVVFDQSALMYIGDSKHFLRQDCKIAAAAAHMMLVAIVDRMLSRAVIVGGKPQIPMDELSGFSYPF